MSALRRNFFTHLAQELRTVEHTLTYVEAALRKVPCNRIFLAHYEHVLADPRAFLEPLSQFLELSEPEKRVSERFAFYSKFTLSTQVLKQRLSKDGRLPSRKAHKLDQYAECKNENRVGKDCYEKVRDYLRIMIVILIDFIIADPQDRQRVFPSPSLYVANICCEWIRC